MAPKSGILVKEQKKSISYEILKQLKFKVRNVGSIQPTTLKLTEN
jgi:hypothetical protein